MIFDLKDPLLWDLGRFVAWFGVAWVRYRLRPCGFACSILAIAELDQLASDSKASSLIEPHQSLEPVWPEAFEGVFGHDTVPKTGHQFMETPQTRTLRRWQVAWQFGVPKERDAGPPHR